jgi:alkylation response protein AidB-like acyl-CoA dehydrogenase
MHEENVVVENRNEWNDEEFRARFRNWLSEYYPDEWRQTDQRPFLRLRGADLRRCMRLLNDHGWRAPAWPREHGGMGLDLRKQWIYQQEWDRTGGARTVEPGETHLAPTLFRFGTVEQRSRLLPRILRCDDLWVQGYSEPSAGSDLAALRTRAIREGEEFVVDGQKIWTTQAAESTHVFALVRTGRFAKKQQGISFLLIDLHSPGVSIRPIVNLAGEDELCEVFFSGVRVPVGNLVGEVDQGWDIAKTLLGHERLWLGSPAMATRALGIAERLVWELGLHEDLGVSDRLAALQANLYDYRALYTRECDRVARLGVVPGPEASMLKIYVSELLQAIVQFSIDVAAEHGGQSGNIRIADWPVNLYSPYMMARPTTIYAGCNELQRDILAKTVLNLAPAPAPASRASPSH